MKGFARGQFVVVIPDNKKALYAWRDEVARVALEQRPAWLTEPLDQPVEVTLTFCRERGDDFLKDGVTLRKGAARLPATAPDVDKLTRAMLDALTGVAFVNDSRVVTCTARKLFAAPGEQARVEVEVRPL